MNNKYMKENIETFFSNLEEFTQNEGILGKAITHGNITFIPIISITMGYGEKANSKEKNSMKEFFGLGAKISTQGVIMIENEEISVISIDGGRIELKEKISKIIDTLDVAKEQKEDLKQQGISL
ncbi:GerW family sporulation protein [Garciella nitratireducens]|uniref:GerW family sporulation protein n=1 Tax=Garciella nitratireducens TaxID=218205 RepID=UPI000DE8EDEA|nr:spore germination protein GerW family protein [Garciella nitratireducens]RBP38958.1 putative spore protein YtfJ [Garciella nitratireducens]